MKSFKHHLKESAESVRRIMDAMMDEDGDVVYEYYGVRRDDAYYAIGDTPEESNVWINGNPSNESLGGTSCIEIKELSDRAIKDALREVHTYMGEWIYLIGGYHSFRGEDMNEIVITDPVIQERLRGNSQ